MSHNQNHPLFPHDAWAGWTRSLGLAPAQADALAAHAAAALEQTARARHQVTAIAAANSLRVLDAFRQLQVDEADLAPSTGYGYNDRGREKLDQLYARIFGAEAALVRPQIVSGTHAISLGLFGLLRPGDELVLATGTPYDTLHGLLGLRPGTPGSLAEFGVRLRQIDLLPDGGPDLGAIAAAVGPQTRAVFIQRSRGYTQRPSLPVATINRVIATVKEANPAAYCLVDNCYGEFVETAEPGADLTAGSLIKNPGGGLATTGGYLAGKAECIELAAARLTAPGVGGEVGPFSAQDKRLFYQGLFLAPHVVGQALQVAHFAAALFERLGCRVDPGPGTPRTDLIQSLELGSADALIAFCQGLQSGSPVESHVRPEPWPMPGYDHNVIMAAGTFTQGASIELSADGPLRPPYAAYLQGGLTLESGIAACLSAAAEMARRGVLEV